jgi:hypothetical protein
MSFRSRRAGNQRGGRGIQPASWRSETVLQKR